MIRNALQIAALTIAMVFGTATVASSAQAGGERAGTTSSKSSTSSKGTTSKGTSTTKAKVGKGVRGTISRKHDVRLLNSFVRGKDGQGTYYLTVDGEFFKLVLDGDEDGVIIELFDRHRDLVVGYTLDDNRVLVLDPKGIVEDSREDRTDLSAIRRYGAAAQLLTDPGFIQQLAMSAGVDLGDEDDDPSAYWVLVAYIIVRCVDVTISGDFEGNAEWSVNISC